MTKKADKADTLNYEGLERVARFARLITLDLVKDPQRPDYLKVERTSGNAGSRDTVRATSAPMSCSIIASARSMPEAMPAEVQMRPSAI